MKKKILITILAIIVVICGGVYGAYKLYFEPVVLENVAEKAQAVLKNEQVKQEVDNFVNEMIEDGTIKIDDIKEYQEYKDMQAAQSTSLSSTNTDAASSQGNTSSQTKSQENKTTVKPVDKNQPLIDRVKSAMTADEFAFSMGIYNKIDIDYVMNTMKTNKSEVKEYVKSHLTSAEISKSLSIYSKYSYLLD